jgi:hypothetical protein
MSVIVLDTNILSLYQRGDPDITSRVNAHPAQEDTHRGVPAPLETAGSMTLDSVSGCAARDQSPT